MIFDKRYKILDGELVYMQNGYIRPFRRKKDNKYLVLGIKLGDSVKLQNVQGID